MNEFNFDNTYINLHTSLFTPILPVKVKSPKTILFNKDLGKTLGLKNIDSEILSGNKIPEGAQPIAQAYAGHQFGQLNILGDGRANLLGEHITPDNSRVDIQLKGSGQTPYSRRGDGRGTYYSMLREFLISHAMENLGISTTRSLAVTTTGEDIYREQLEPGAVLTRVASSHIRVGTFQYVAMQGDYNLLKTFSDYVINRHYPSLLTSENPYLSLLEVVMIRQIDLITDWLRVGFIHGVMNTDNVSIAGETIDYGPCAFMDIYDPDTCFSSIDRNGRYSYKNQENLGGWNIARFAETLIPLINKDTELALKEINSLLEEYKPLFKKSWTKKMGEKLGIKNNSDSDIIELFLDWMFKNKLDFTKTFQELTTGEIFKDEDDNTLQLWKDRWDNFNIDYALMKKSNPVVIPRNHIVESVLESAVKGEMEPFNNFFNTLSKPFNENHDNFYKYPPVNIDKNYKTFCGT